MSPGKPPTPSGENVGRARGRPSSQGPSLLERMKGEGLRLTGQRRLLAEVLDGAAGHLDADAVYRLALERDPRIHRATVYRTLGKLKRLGLVDELDLMHFTGERHFYEVHRPDFHIHLVCMSCGRVEEPGGPFWEDLKRRVERETSFFPETVRLEMGGLCRHCRAGRRARPPTRRADRS